MARVDRMTPGEIAVMNVRDKEMISKKRRLNNKQKLKLKEEREKADALLRKEGQANQDQLIKPEDGISSRE